MKVAVNPPRTPVTTGSQGVAAATVPNVCKMPGPPAPFVPTPLPNIGRSNLSPSGYSQSVTIEGQKVAIRGASFGSQGDMASKGTGGGVVSGNTHGETKFIAPGSMDVKFEGKNVQLLGDAMSNNHGGPANAATLMGLLQSPLLPEAPASGEMDPCNHVWKVLESKPGKTPSEAASDNDALVQRNQGKPSMANTMRGYSFENKAVEANMTFMSIQTVGREYICELCKQKQDVDIVGDKRIAEAKSRNFEGVKKKSRQARRIRDIQQKLFDKNQNPLAKLDGGLEDHEKSAGKYLERGFDVEIVP
ncbi:DUF4150 domain-containing protein [Myxococcus sp. MxC21-1]|uniref:PAAR-like domain-containing protein n=1 Tax=Myxococcus sp. MxC21-1 TaxID=3041439 RepID=UPI00292E76BD|nr:PAAR-like domain-containing protein [Myxococcus sp. MxC21-1]WNZ61371.1 DUF4150 domain-containing protein [Myxococcus sp. MxC21-1]